MLENLKISRFKSVKDLSLNFGKVNLLIGGNGSGKSNILEAIGLLSACLGRGISDADIGAKGLRITPSELMKSSFKGEGFPSTFSLEARFSSNLNYSASLRSSELDPFLAFFAEKATFGQNRIFGRSNRGAQVLGQAFADRFDPHRGILDQVQATHELPPELRDEFSEFGRYVIFNPQTDFLRGIQGGPVQVPPVGLHGEGLPSAVSSFLKLWRQLEAAEKKEIGSGGIEWQIIENCIKLVWLPGWASSFGSHRANPKLTSSEIGEARNEVVYFVDKFMHAKRNRLSVYDSSEGTLFLLFAAIILSHPFAPRVFALDNVDNALNPTLTRALVKKVIDIVKLSPNANLGARQVFLTSHNPTALDAFDLFDEELRVFVVSRNEKGHTGAVRLEPTKGMSKQDWQLMMRGRNLSQVWLDGDIPGAMGMKL